MKLHENYDWIIFDLDGTLWDTVDVCLETLEQVKSKHLDITKEITREQVKSSMGKDFEEIMKIYYGYLPEEKAIVYAKEAFNKNIENLLKEGGKLYTNTKNTIINLSKDYKLFIVSNCIEGYIESFFKTSGLGKYFEDYESNGKTGLSKGENIKLVINRNNLRNAVYIGDTLKDKEAAEHAKIPFIYASYGFGEVDGCKFKIDDIGELTVK